jgi:predicted dehydrogenase
MLKVAVIGLGWWGRKMIGEIARSRKLRAVRAIDIDPAAGQFARANGVAFSADIQAALADPEVEAVILCTPHSRHREQIAQAVDAGKHVFCEKPLALLKRDAEEAVALCNARGVVLGVGHERRFEPPILELARLARGGALGQLLQFEANFSQDKFLALPADNWRLSALDAPAGPMTATGIHLLDLGVSLLGPAETALARVAQLGSRLANGDTLGALVTFRTGANALITAILATPFFGRVALFGSEGWAEVRDLSHPEDSQGWTMTTCRRGGRPLTVDYPPASGVLANLEAFADAALGRAPYPMPQAEMVATISALEAIVRSAESKAVERVER